MQTIVQLDNSNCGSCLNTMADHLRGSEPGASRAAQPGYGMPRGRPRASRPILADRGDREGCARLELASNGEVVMVELDVHEEFEFPWREELSDTEAVPGDK